MGFRGLLLGLGALGALAHPACAADGGRGATVPWITYEAEQAKTNGATVGPDFTGQTAAREASGRTCLSLASAGQHVDFTAKSDADAIVVRYSIPDSADGHGIDATLTLTINGQHATKLKLTSRYSHLYGPYPFTNTPSTNAPRNFWDEARLLTGPIHAGDTIRLEKAADDSAAEYLIDCIDLEPVPAPIEKPADALAITDFGATANDATDDRPALLAAIAAAKTQKKIVWVPQGDFVIKGTIDVADVDIRGAGMWHTTLIGVDDYTPANRVAFEGVGSNIHLSDFAIVGKLNYRSDGEANDGIGGSFGIGSTLRNLWIEHTKTGAWLVNSDGLTVEGCRFRNTIADGINLCLGVHGTVVRNCTTRGTGDDCFAMWPANYAKAAYTHGENKFLHCTAQLPFLAQAFSIYGGDNNAVEACSAIDIPYGAGLYASTTFKTDDGFAGTTRFSNNSILRAGGTEGAIGTCANLIDLKGVRFEDIDVMDSPNDGIKFISLNKHALVDASFDRVRITNAGIAGAGYGIAEAGGALGSATMTHVTIANAKSAGWQDNAPEFELVRGEGNKGIEDGRTSRAEEPATGKGPVER